MYRFLNLALSRHPMYQTVILPRLKDPNSDDILLDIGTCFGQDVRKLLYDGVSAARIKAGDILTEFWELGFELFRDRDRIPNGLFLYPANLFDPDSILSHSGKFGIIHMNAVFHLFDYENQVKMAKQVAKLLRPGPGALIVGQQSANFNAGEYPSRSGDPNKSLYRHNSESWAQMWERVGKELASETGAEDFKFKAESELFRIEPPKGVERPDGGQWSQLGFSRMRFTVERL